jgi:hypothetical protein
MANYRYVNLFTRRIYNYMVWNILHRHVCFSFYGSIERGDVRATRGK